MMPQAQKTVVLLVGAQDAEPVDEDADAPLEGVGVEVVVAGGGLEPDIIRRPTHSDSLRPSRAQAWKQGASWSMAPGSGSICRRGLRGDGGGLSAGRGGWWHRRSAEAGGKEQQGRAGGYQSIAMRFSWSDESHFTPLAILAGWCRPVSLRVALLLSGAVDGRRYSK